MKYVPCFRCSSPVTVAENTAKATCWRCVNKIMTSSAAPPMKSAPAPDALRKLVSTECSNFTNGKHMGDRPCHILSGHRCDFFESAILPTERGQSAATDYQLRYMSAVASTQAEPESEHTEKPQVRFSPETCSVLKAIRHRCLDCQEKITDVLHCPFNGQKDALCDLWPYRTGHNPKLAGKGNTKNPRFLKTPTHRLNTPNPPPHESKDTSMTTRRQKITGGWEVSPQFGHPRGPRAAVHSHCTWCSADLTTEVKSCPSSTCPLHPFRFGRKLKPKQAE